MFDQEIFRKNYTLTIQQVGQRLQSKVLLLETLRIVTERLYHSDMLTMSKITSYHVQSLEMTFLWLSPCSSILPFSTLEPLMTSGLHPL